MAQIFFSYIHHGLEKKYKKRDWENMGIIFKNFYGLSNDSLNISLSSIYRNFARNLGINRSFGILFFTNKFYYKHKKKSLKRTYPCANFYYMKIYNNFINL